MLLDVFRTDAFHWTKLVDGINRLPFAPTRMGDSGLFTSKPINTTIASFEMRDGTLTLVAAGQRGQRGAPKGVGRRKMVDVRTTHLPQSVSILADEVQGLRAFGSESETETAMNYLMQKVAVARLDLDITHEFHRVKGALTGKVYDADGTTVLHDFFTLFGLSPTTHSFDLDSASVNVNEEVRKIKRKVEDKLGGLVSARMVAYCGATYFDKLCKHSSVVDLVVAQQGKEWREGDKRVSGVVIEDVLFTEYRGKVGSIDYIDPAKAYVVPTGVPQMFQSLYAPADYMETVNTMGVPFYMKGEDMPFNKGIDYDIQSNPLHINTRPEAVCEVSDS